MIDTDHKPKVLYVITKSNWGGAQRYVYDLATRLNTDFEVAVACGGNGLLVQKLEQAGIKCFVVNGFKRDIDFWQEVKAFFSLLKILRLYRPDIVHLNSTKAGLLGAILGRICRIEKIIFTVHGWPFLEPRKKLWRLLAWLGSYLTAILCHQLIMVSHNDYRRTNMPGIKQKSTVIHPAVANYPRLHRTEAREKLYDKNLVAEHNQHIWLVTIAELNKNKNQSLVINAVAEYNSTNQTKIFYTLIGDGDDYNELQEQVALKGLHDYVRLLGQVDNAPQYLEAFDIFILPSKKEGLPYVLLEAALANIPIICTAVGGIPELITNYETGLLVSSDNHKETVDALTALFENPNLRNDFAINLEAGVKAEFNIDDMCRRTAIIYQRKS